MPFINFYILFATILVVIRNLEVLTLVTYYQNSYTNNQATSGNVKKTFSFDLVF